MALEAILAYPGLNSVISASIPRHHGITPDLITIECVPQQKVPRHAGDITLVYGPYRVTLPDCLLDSTSFSFDERGELWSLKMWDYRWKWIYNDDLSGRYNVRLPNGPVDRLDPLTEKPIKDLLTKCLEKMRIPKGFAIVGTIPLIYPEVYWSYSNPARELQKLCDLIGYRIVAQFDGKVYLVPLGKALDGKTEAAMPKNLPTEVDQEGYDPPEIPERIALLFGPTLYQFTLPLEAVADDIDGLIRPLDEVSFKPAGGWGKCNLRDFLDVPLISGGDLTKWYNLPSPRELAKASVYRKYRIRVLNKDGQPFVGEYIGNGQYASSKLIYIPGTVTVVRDVRQILPLGGTLIEPVKTDDGWFRNIPFIIWGQFARGMENNFPDSGLANANLDTIPTMITRSRHPVFGTLQDPQESTCLQPEDFSVDVESGIVTINGPTNGRIYKYGRDSNDRLITLPAKLWMRGVCQVKEWGTWVPIKASASYDANISDVIKTSDASVIKAGQKTIEDSSLYMRVVPVYKSDKITLDKVTDNSEILVKEGNRRLNIELEKLRTRRPASARLAGWFPLKLDGGIQEICYTLGQSGAYTLVSKNADFFVQEFTYEQKRFLEQAADERSDPKKKALLDMIRQRDLPFSRASGISRSGL